MTNLAALVAAEFPWTADATFLNSASTGPLPERSRRAVDAFNAKRATPYLLPDADLFAIFTESRELAARLLNAEPREIALATNTSYGLNVAARALPLVAGDIVLLSDKEFPANVYPWLALRKQGITVEVAPTTPEGWPDEAYLLRRIAEPRVKVLAVSLVQFANGYKVDLAALSAATRATGTWLVVDAIQGLGVEPVDLRRTPVDILSSGAQKWLLSPWGSGFTYIRRELIEQVDPMYVGWTAFEGTDDFSRMTEYSTTFRADARRFEMITLPFQDFVGMNASLRLLMDVGIDRIAAHVRELHRPVLDWAEEHGVRVASPVGDHASAIVCLAPPDPQAAYAALREARIYTSLREGAIRLSPHLYNTAADMSRVCDVLARTLQEKQHAVVR
jgi:selenocysteine lyase/cysteine desulfurase